MGFWGYPQQDTTDVSAETLDLRVLTGFEPINVDAVKRLAALKASAHVRIEIGGSTLPLRTAIMHLVLRACKRLPYRGPPEANGIRQILTAWCESGTFPEEVVGKLRRHSGVHEVESLEEKHQQMTQSLQDFGLSVYAATCSVFVAPRWFKHIARAGILGVDLDQSKSAVRAMLERHPWAKHLKAYIDDEAPYHHSLGGSHDERKGLFRAFLCGGGRGLLSKYEAEHRCHADQNVLGFWEGGKTLQEPQGNPQKAELALLALLAPSAFLHPPPAEMQRCKRCKRCKFGFFGGLLCSCGALCPCLGSSASAASASRRMSGTIRNSSSS